MTDQLTDADRAAILGPVGELTTCPACQGSGRQSGDTRYPPGSCSTCDGEGKVRELSVTVPCQACAGLGQHWLGQSWIFCRACDGSGSEVWRHIERPES